MPRRLEPLSFLKDGVRYVKQPRRLDTAERWLADDGSGRSMSRRKGADEFGEPLPSGKWFRVGGGIIRPESRYWKYPFREDPQDINSVFRRPLGGKAPLRALVSRVIRTFQGNERIQLTICGLFPRGGGSPKIADPRHALEGDVQNVQWPSIITSAQSIERQGADVLARGEGILEYAQELFGDIQEVYSFAVRDAS